MRPVTRRRHVAASGADQRMVDGVVRLEWIPCHAVRASMLQLARALLAAPLAQTGSHGSHVAERPVPSLTVDSPSFPGVKRYC